MSQEDVFDAFYRSTRSDVLLQAFLLTGDLTAATAAVKDAYTITWQHWKKVVLRGEPDRPRAPLAYRLAQRRHAGRIWHRNKGLSDEHKQVLDAVHKLGGSRAPDAAARRRRPGRRAHGGARVGDDVRHRRRPSWRQPRWRAEVTESLGAAYARAPPHARRARTPPPSCPALRSFSERAASVVGCRRRRRGPARSSLTVGVGAAAREPGLERASGLHQVLNPAVVSV